MAKPLIGLSIGLTFSYLLLFYFLNYSDAKILHLYMQKYGKNLKHSRDFPIFYTFAVLIKKI